MAEDEIKGGRVLTSHAADERRLDVFGPSAVASPGNMSQVAGEREMHIHSEVGLASGSDVLER
jgi:hypothetical protein